MSSNLKRLCREKGLKCTKNMEIICDVISKSPDHPNVEDIFKRAAEINHNIGIATVYRIVRALEENGIIAKHDFGEGKARYEEMNEDEHHDHLIDVNSGKVVEFFNEEIERLQEKIAEDLGYKLIGHRLELYAVPLKDSESE